MNRDDAKKWAWGIGLGLTFIALMGVVKVQGFSGGITAGALILTLVVVRHILPTSNGRIRAALICIIAFVVLWVFVGPAFQKVFMPDDTNSITEAWRTRKVEKHLWITRWLYSPEAGSRELLEKLCRDENKRLVLEMKVTRDKIQEIARDNKALLGLSKTIEKPLKNMTLDEALKDALSEEPTKQYHILLKVLQYQQENIVREYKQCMRVQEEKRKGILQTLKDSAPAGTQDKLDDVWGKIANNPKQFALISLGFVTLAAMIIGMRFGSTKRYGRSDRWFWIFIVNTGILVLVAIYF